MLDHPQFRHKRSRTVPEPADAEIVRNPALSRWELQIDGEVRGLVDYRIEPDGRVALTHTEVDHALRGKGFSPVLVSRVLDDVRADGQRAVARCRYVRDFAKEHPEYADLFAS
jgi:uncharacterized protein